MEQNIVFTIRAFFTCQNFWMQQSNQCQMIDGQNCSPESSVPLWDWRIFLHSFLVFDDEWEEWESLFRVYTMG